ncbi:MAG: hypothetical protein QXK93_07575 [Candidatus Bathyarchaeia archaeon]
MDEKKNQSDLVTTTTITMPIYCTMCGKKLGDYCGEPFYTPRITCINCYIIYERPNYPQQI